MRRRSASAQHTNNLGSADEHLFDESLTVEQREWLRDFCAAGIRQPRGYAMTGPDFRADLTGAEFRAIREALGLTQTDFSRALG